jgi:hypothetical protein
MWRSNKSIVACLLFLLLPAGCASVAGRIRPVWNQSWSRLTMEPSNSAGARSGTLRVVFRGPDGELPLSEATITVTDQFGHGDIAVTDLAGTASFHLLPGPVSVKAEMLAFATHRSTVNVIAGQTAILEVFSRRTTEEIMSCCD